MSLQILIFFLKTYLLGIACFAIFRLVLSIVCFNELTDVPVMTYLGSLFMGFRFDTVISGYILAIPFLLSIAIELIPLKSYNYKMFLFALIFITYSVSFALCATDIPYYNYFNSRLTISIFNWISTPSIMLDMLVSSPAYYPFILMFIVMIFVFFILLRKILRSWQNDHLSRVPVGWWRIKNMGFFVAFSIIMFIGIRGRIEQKSPIRWGTAYFSIYAFPNQLGLNPVFTFIYSILEKDKMTNDDLMDPATAINYVRNYFNINNVNEFDSPIARDYNKDSAQNKYNVVIVLMESMSSGYLGSSGRFAPSATPFLDSISRNSYYFDNFYSIGIHTFTGIHGVFLSMPSPLSEGNPFDNMDNMRPFAGIAQILRENGYHTLFACPHDEQFDNIGGAMRANGFERIVSQQDFFGGLSSPWGVEDHVLFERTLPHINELAAGKTPFLAVLLTTSNHGPYYVPDDRPADFVIHQSDEKLRAVEYADHSMQYFIDQARKEDWFDNTLFVFVADHGRKFTSPYLMDLDYNHIPMIIYAPKIIIKPQVINNIGMQIDIFPTVMHLLGFEYINNTLGIDLLSEKRPYAYFTADKILGIVDSVHFYYKMNKRNRGYV